MHDLADAAHRVIGEQLHLVEPLGAFEMAPFDTATVALARIAAALTKEGSLVSVAGGGDTVAAVDSFGLAEQFSFVSTGGGATLSFLAGERLPGLAVLGYYDS